MSQVTTSKNIISNYVQKTSAAFYKTVTSYIKIKYNANIIVLSFTNENCLNLPNENNLSSG